MTNAAFMAKAIQLARRGWNTTTPNPRVGCVLVRDGKIVGEGWHVQAGLSHAEVNALRDAGDAAKGATAYISLEPCNHQGRTGPCSQALIAAGVSEVVVAMLDPNPQVSGSGMACLRDAGIAVSAGVLQAQAEALNPGYIQRMARGRPQLSCKLAMSVDGRTAMASGESQWITGPQARADVQRLRAQSCAIVTGSGTVVADNPAMTVRDVPVGAESQAIRQPLRVVLDTGLRCEPGARIFNGPGNCVLVHGNAVSAVDKKVFTDTAPQVELIEQAGASIVLADVLALLAQRQCNDVLVECGANLAGALLQAQLIDQLVVYMAPLLLGSDARPLLNLPLAAMQDKVALNIDDVRAVGADWRMTITPAYTSPA